MANISTITIKGTTYDLRDAESRNQISNINANIQNRLAYMGSSTNLPKYGVTVGDVWYVGKTGYFARKVESGTYKTISITWQDGAYMHQDYITNPTALAVDKLEDAVVGINSGYTQIDHYYFANNNVPRDTVGIGEFYIVPVWADESHNTVVVCFWQEGTQYAYVLSESGAATTNTQLWHGYLATEERLSEDGQRPTVGYLIPCTYTDAGHFTIPTEDVHEFSIGNEQTITWEEFDNDYVALDASSKIDSTYLNYQMMDLSTYQHMDSYDSNVFYFITDVNEAAEGQA